MAMSDQTHTRGDAGALDDDFEWVNTWATSMRPAAAAASVPATPATAAPATDTGAASVRADRPNARARTDTSAAPAGTSGNRIVRNMRKAEAAPISVVPDTKDPARGVDALVVAAEPTPTPLAGRRGGRWTSLFRLASRTSTPEAEIGRASCRERM